MSSCVCVTSTCIKPGQNTESESVPVIEGLPAIRRCFPHSTGTSLGLLKGIFFDSFSSVVSVRAVPLRSAKVNSVQALNPLSMSSATDSPGMPMN